MNIQEQNKFEFLLTLDNNIICQRFFNVRDYNPQSRRSLDLHYLVKEICEEIGQDLKIKSSNYLVENQNYVLNSANVEEQSSNEEQHFLLQIKQNDDVFIERIFLASVFHPKVRYSVDIRPKLRRILADLTETMSRDELETTYLQYEL
jgi:hypothetical protein